MGFNSGFKGLNYRNAVLRLGLDSCDTGQAFPRSCHLKVLGLTFHHERKRQVRRGVVVCAQGTAFT